MLGTRARLRHVMVVGLAISCRVYDESLIEGAATRSADEPDSGADGSIGKPPLPPERVPAVIDSGLARDTSAGGSGGVSGGAGAAGASGAGGSADDATAAAGSGGHDGGDAVADEDAGPPPEPAPCTEVGGKVWTNNGHCYFPIAVVNTWYMNRDRCNQLGARLVSIASEEEQRFVAAVVGAQPSWTGLSRFGAPYFTWLGSEPVTYENWEDGEPGSMTESAVALRGGTAEWFDDPVTTQYGAICERQ